jgi:hypothetical protein
MGQVGIVRKEDGVFYREYAIEPDDQLIPICLRFGQKDWYHIYHDLPVNQPFEDRFPDPDQIDFVNPVNFFIPLVGATTSGKSKKGAPIGDYYIAHVEDVSGAPYASKDLVLVGPGLPPAGALKPVTTTAQGDVIVENPGPGDWYLVSPVVTLTAKASVATVVPSRDVTATTPTPVITDPVKLTRNAIDTLVARDVVCLRCPMCWQIFAVTEQSSPGTAYTCPNDAFNWGSIVADVSLSLTSFLSAPTPSQIAPASGCSSAQPTSVPSPLLCRGVETALLKSVYGDARIFWDESRFVNPNGGNYTLWGKDASGTLHTADIVGRATWGALPPIWDGTRAWDFHRTTGGCASPAHSYAIANNEVTSLRDTFKWGTIHHTGSGIPNAYPTPHELQTEHQVHGPGTGGPAADIAYHYFIDAAGTIFEGRPVGIKGSHVDKFNGGNVGMVLTGNFEDTPLLYETPTAAQITSMNVIAHAVAARFQIASIWYHHERDIQTGKTPADATACCGQRLIPVAALLRPIYPGPPP